MLSSPLMFMLGVIKPTPLSRTLRPIATKSPMAAPNSSSACVTSASLRLEPPAMYSASTSSSIGLARSSRGRRALMKEGRNEVGPYQSPMEDGMRHFHAWYRRAMGAAVGAAPAP